MTARQIIIKCLDENTDVTCRKSPCDKSDKEVNEGKCCHECSLEILKEYENKIYNKAIDEITEKAMKQFTEFDSKHGYPTVADCKDILSDIAEQLKS